MQIMLMSLLWRVSRRHWMVQGDILVSNLVDDEFVSLVLPRALMVNGLFEFSVFQIFSWS